ncbi:hypothetical protein M0802_008167 [Mischocyttarus mexicanus]|nr:hypothetical protein M0802_008167 [Mischocyttarus mexicanus]
MFVIDLTVVHVTREVNKVSQAQGIEEASENKRIRRELYLCVLSNDDDNNDGDDDDDDNDDDDNDDDDGDGHSDTTPVADEKRTQDSNGVHRSLSVCEGSAASLSRAGITTPTNPHYSPLRAPTNRACQESTRRGEV